MSRLPLVDPSHAQGQAHDLFEAVRSRVGRVSNMMKAMANSPAVLEGYLGLSGALAGGSLDPKLRERIAIEAAQSHGCNYCLAAHDLTGRLAGLDEEERLANRRGHSHDPKADVALEFTRTLIDGRGNVTGEDIRRVKEAGYSDGEVAEIMALVALNVLTNYFNIAVETPIDFPAVEPLEWASA
jgi:AhpD family alkylhydroperoxidase